MAAATFFNTTNETGGDLVDATKAAGHQEQHVEAFFRQHDRDRGWTPGEVHKAVFNHWVPLTSVRRAMTNLTSKGVLVKTDIKRRGRYRRNEYAWRIANPPHPQRSLL